MYRPIASAADPEHFDAIPDANQLFTFTPLRIRIFMYVDQKLNSALLVPYITVVDVGVVLWYRLRSYL